VTREYIKLTDQQRLILRPYIERVQTAKSMGSPGMLVGQVSWDESGAWFVPIFIPHAKAVFLEETGNTSIPGRREPCAPGQCLFITYKPQGKHKRAAPPTAVCANCGRVRE
jgi:hypothetical protein